MKKTSLTMILALCAVFVFGQKITNLKTYSRSTNLVNRTITDSVHTSITMKLIIEGMVLQEGTSLGKEYYENETTYGNEIKSWSFTKESDSPTYIKEDSVLTPYDSKGIKISEKIYVWDEQENSWKIPINENYTYSGDTIITSEDGEITGKEIIYYKNGLQDSIVDFEKDNGIWMMLSSMKFSYDAENKPTLIMYYNYDKNNKTFIKTMKQVGSYGTDKDGKKYGYFKSSIWNGTLWGDTATISMDSNGDEINDISYQQVLIIENTIYYTTKQVLAVTDKEIYANSISIYPNPTDDGIYINSDSENVNNISIYDLKGNKVLSEKKQRNEYIPMSALSKGIYIITITNEDGVFREKLIKK